MSLGPQWGALPNANPTGPGPAPTVTYGATTHGSTANALPENQRKKDHLPLILGIIAVILLVCVGGVGALVYVASDQTGKKVSPHGAPYSFRIPTGFVQGVSTSGYPLGKPDHESTIVPEELRPGDRTAIVVSSRHLDFDADLRHYAELEAATNTAIREVDGTRIAKPKRLTIDNKRTLRYQLRWDGVSQWSYLTFVGRVSVQTRCQWDKSSENALKEACAKVIGDLSIRTTG